MRDDAAIEDEMIERHRELVCKQTMSTQPCTPVNFAKRRFATFAASSISSLQELSVYDSDVGLSSVFNALNENDTGVREECRKWRARNAASNSTLYNADHVECAKHIERATLVREPKLELHVLLALQCKMKSFVL